MQKITAGITRPWNAGCLGKLAIGLIGLIVLGCIGSALGGWPAVRQAGAPTAMPAAPTPTEEPAPTSAPHTTRAPAPTILPTSLPSPIPTAPPTVAIVLKGVAPVGEACPPEAPIKGNIVDRGERKGEKIYHVPGSSSYQQTKPERCFATAADAESAGFRAPER